MPGSNRFVLGEPQGRRFIVHVPSNVLLDRWEEEGLGEPDGKGGRRKSKFPLITSGHVGVYRASDSFKEKQEALKKPVILIVNDSARIIANREPPVIDCSNAMRRDVLELLIDQTTIKGPEFR